MALTLPQVGSLGILRAPLKFHVFSTDSEFAPYNAIVIDLNQLHNPSAVERRLRDLLNTEFTPQKARFGPKTPIFNVYVS